MRIHLKALGCRLNEAELEQWAREFSSSGHQIATQAQEADLIVLNTCAVTQEAVRKSRHTLKRLHRDSPGAKLVLTGCYASLDPEAARAQGVDLIVDNRDKPRLVEITRQELATGDMPSTATEPGDAALFSRGRHRAFIKVQDGCRYRCTFCIVTVARGQERSRPMSEIIEEIQSLSQQGVKEAVLTGVHVGGYGDDLEGDLATLIEAILRETDLPRLRLASVEPWDLPEDFFTLFENPRLMPHMHLPLQSGADSVLRRMARRCKTGEFEDLVMQARRHIPGFNVTTDVIAGFPGETEDEWHEGLAFIERIGFGHLHIFTYSPRAGTKAATLPDQVPDAVKKARSRELHALGERMKRETLQAAVGQTFNVLWERAGTAEGKTLVPYSGYTPHYLRVKTRAEPGTDLENRLCRVRITGLEEDAGALTGELLD